MRIVTASIIAALAISNWLLWLNAIESDRLHRVHFGQATLLYTLLDKHIDKCK